MAWDQVVPGVNVPNGQAILPLHVPAGTRGIDLNLYNSSIGSPGSADYGLSVLVDGVYSQEIPAAAANGYNLGHIVLDGAAHDVDVVQSFTNSNTQYGNYVQGFSGPGVTLRSGVNATTRRLVFYGDSIADGAYGSPLGRFSYFARLRAVFPGRLAGEMWGGRKLFDDINAGGVGLKDIDVLAARLVALAQLGGASTRSIWIEMGYNDWSGNTYTTGQWTTNLASLLTKVHALDSAITIYVQSLIVTGNEAATNGNGNTPPQWRTATSNACSGLGYVTYVDGLTLMVAGGLNADGIHPSTNGHASIFDGSGGFAGSTNLRTVLGV